MEIPDQEKIEYHKILPIITFEGSRLQKHALLLDHAGSIPGVPDDTGLWFWRFSIAAGGRSDSSKNLRHHVFVLLKILKKRGIAAVNESSVSGELYDHEEVFSDWIKSLEEMLALSAEREECSWSTNPRPAPESVKGSINPPLGERKGGGDQ